MGGNGLSKEVTFKLRSGREHSRQREVLSKGKGGKELGMVEEQKTGRQGVIEARAAAQGPAWAGPCGSGAHGSPLEGLK